jgi:hypothetical protein
MGKHEIVKPLWFRRMIETGRRIANLEVVLLCQLRDLVSQQQNDVGFMRRRHTVPLASSAADTRFRRFSASIQSGRTK